MTWMESKNNLGDDTTEPEVVIEADEPEDEPEPGEDEPGDQMVSEP